MIKSVLKYIETHFGTILIFMVSIAFILPHLLAPLQEYIDKFLMIALFLGCLKIDFDEFSHLKANIHRIVILSVASMLLLPFVVFGLTFWLPLPIALGVTMVAAAPGAMMSPLIAGMYNLRILWTSVYVIISSIILPVFLPYLIVFLFGSKVDFSILEMSLFLTKMILIPATLAFIFKKYFRKASDFTAKNSGFVGTLLITVFIAAIIAGNRDFLISSFSAQQTYIALITMILVFILRFAVGYYIPSSELRERLTNCMMIGCMNNGIIIIVANRFFSSDVQLVLLLSEIPWSFSLPIFGKFMSYKTQNPIELKS